MFNKAAVYKRQQNKLLVKETQFSKNLRRNHSSSSHLVLSTCSWTGVIKMHDAFKPAQEILAVPGCRVIIRRAGLRPHHPWQSERRAIGSSKLCKLELISLLRVGRGPGLKPSGSHQPLGSGFLFSNEAISEHRARPLRPICPFFPGGFLNGKCSGVT